MDIMSITDIPVYINNRDRLTTTRNLVQKLLSLNPKEKIIIIDNGSSYEPLLSYYNSKYTAYPIEIIYGPNYGHLAFWQHRIHETMKPGDVFVYTDSDIQLNPDMPANWKEVMLRMMVGYNVPKVGLALDLKDIPDHYALREQVRGNEALWWLNELEPNVFEADTDTTFCLMKNTGDNPYKSVRIAGNFTAKHMPWYINTDDMDAEEIYYTKNVCDDYCTQYTKQHKYPNLYIK
jgi:glycosyltransferase involved in cell wall biosynthesis